MNNSFYGGRDGQPMVIKAKFASVEDMTAEFAKPEYVAVNFGEYALIETVNRKNPENGFLFRRGYDYQDEDRYVECWEFNDRTGNFDKSTTLAKGAIYIGKIAGPAGDAPLVEFKDAETVKNERNDLLANIDSQKEVNGNSVSLSVDNGGLISGSASNGEITYHWYSVRDTDGVSSKVCLGFEIPYYEIALNNVTPVSPGTAPSIERTLTEGNPFYETWTFKIPEGIPGNSVEWIDVIAETEASNFNLKTFKYDENGIPKRIADTGLLDLGEYSLSTSEAKQILIARIIEWDKKNKVETLKYVYLADYKTINKITYSEPTAGGIQEDFKLEVEYGDGTTDVICEIDPLNVGASFSFGKYNEPGENLRLNGIHFVLDDWNPPSEDEEVDKDLIHYPGGVLQPYSEDDIKNILADVDKNDSNQ